MCPRVRVGAIRACACLCASCAYYVCLSCPRSKGIFVCIHSIICLLEFPSPFEAEGGGASSASNNSLCVLALSLSPHATSCQREV